MAFSKRNYGNHGIGRFPFTSQPGIPTPIPNTDDRRSPNHRRCLDRTNRSGGRWLTAAGGTAGEESGDGLELRRLAAKKATTTGAASPYSRRRLRHSRWHQRRHSGSRKRQWPPHTSGRAHTLPRSQTVRDRDCHDNDKLHESPESPRVPTGRPTA